MTVLAVALGAAWGALATRALLHRVPRRRPLVRRRLAAVSSAPTRERWRARVVPRAVARRATLWRTWHDRRARERAVAAHVPVTVDLVRVAVDAGATPFGAVELAARFADPLVRAVLARVVTDVRLGVVLPDALARECAGTAALQPLADALTSAHRLGTPLAPTLDRLALDARRTLRRRAEARARTAPVRLLFPLVFLVLPAFGLLTVVPALLDGWRGI